MYQRAITDMEKAEIVTVDNRGGEKNVRLRNHRWRRNEYENYIPETYMEYYEQTAVGAILDLSSGSKDKTTASRILKNSATKIMMYACGIEIGPDKRDLRREMLENEDVIYYNSNEIKQIESYHDQVHTQKTKKGEYSKKLINSRINGVLISPGGIYAIYNIGNALIEWKRFGEVKMATYIAGLIRHKSIADVSINNPKEAIVIARTDLLFAKICLGHYKKNSKTVLMNIDYAYDRLYAVPESRDGVIILKMMIKNGWQKKILDSIIPETEQLAKETVSVECDGYDSDKGIYKLVFCIPNLQKLKSFVARAEFAAERERYYIYCFTYQANLIVNVAGTNVKLLKTDLNDFYKNYFNK